MPMVSFLRIVVVLGLLIIVGGFVLLATMQSAAADPAYREVDPE